MAIDVSLPTLSERLAAVSARVAEAAADAGRSPAEVMIVAVSKTVSRAAVDEVHALGLRHFGENRVQEARGKFADPPLRGATLSLIGQLQSNKARAAVHLFDRIESVDRPSLIEALARATASVDQPLSVLLQVNIAAEGQKAGCAAEEALSLARSIVARPGLRLDGLMTIAPLVVEAEEARPIFCALRLLRDRLREQLPNHELATLSMGMSNDFPVAIAEGATHVRIGRAIFGERQEHRGHG
ncbi:MAG: YggS family pyridoxal phosphate-dependent enzyme [Chloroflexia bacterium]|nr:YggS family pyridoxal phosphate-dependent enzyme [Chloroflexia bacterium]